jgi:tRNA-specific 2-thiouridylase
MSGGVDSSVAAALMVRQGYDVIGLTMQIWQESQTDPRHAGCCSLGAVEDARRVAKTLGIDHYVMNFREEFRKAVIDDFVDQYERGRTPNPCVQCNRHVKFEILLEKVRELGCDRLVTGHYARIRRDHRTGLYRLLRARGPEKDQSYVLYMLGQRELSQCCFPMGELPSKEAGRALAREMGLVVADKPDSQEICFVSEAGGYREFLQKQRPEAFSSGEIVDVNGQVVGKHEGLPLFTVGQRKGLPVKNQTGKPLYVLGMAPDRNRVVVGPEESLSRTEVPMEEVFWPQGSPNPRPTRVEAKIRYNMDPQPATLFSDHSPRLVFDRPVRAVTPGQIAVAYRGKSVIAGGTIAS